MGDSKFSSSIGSLMSALFEIFLYSLTRKPQAVYIANLSLLEPWKWLC
jgi:hypothetical protein